MGNTLKKLYSPIVWGNLLAMAVVAVGLLIGVKVFLDRYTRHGEEIEVPNVTGRLAADACDALAAEGLTGVVTDSLYEKGKPTGSILSQLPAAGSHVKAGREIHLTVNASAASTVRMPDIADNSSVREAQERLRLLGFQTTVNLVEGDRDWVYAVKYEGRNVFVGDRVPAGATLELQVGRGTGEDDSPTLPDDDEHSVPDIFDL